MKDRIDPLIEERAPWLFAGRPGTRYARAALNAMLGYERTLEIGRQVEPLPSAELMRTMADMLARDVRATGLENIPRQGPALVVCNHPTGIADGIMLFHLLHEIRPDLYFFANHDILRVLPQMHDMIAPVEWRQEKRSHGKTRETMAYTRQAVEDGRLGIIFPSGRLAKRRGLSLHERPWMASAAMIARKYDLPVIPLNIRARNSVLFYLFDFLHATLRDITLFHEMLNKGRQPYRITVGEPISAKALPQKSDDGIEMLRRATLALGGRKAPAVSLLDASRRPSWLKSTKTV
ncbi:lysophospholipid acyltransferase family protein [Litorisediminicola beolgyonensis]|uniref:Lysophospholipid acyltransferase family protein n=1 Tax=Litorisediminicola beolgyonensis TaxID=1173614 RepID=A0ABW3ZH05_9RHOB